MGKNIAKTRFKKKKKKKKFSGELFNKVTFGEETVSIKSLFYFKIMFLGYCYEFMK